MPSRHRQHKTHAATAQPVSRTIPQNLLGGMYLLGNASNIDLPGKSQNIQDKSHKAWSLPLRQSWVSMLCVRSFEPLGSTCPMLGPPGHHHTHVAVPTHRATEVWEQSEKEIKAWCRLPGWIMQQTSQNFILVIFNLLCHKLLILTCWCHVFALQLPPWSCHTNTFI